MKNADFSCIWSLNNGKFCCVFSNYQTLETILIVDLNKFPIQITEIAHSGSIEFESLKSTIPKAVHYTVPINESENTYGLFHFLHF